MMMKRPATTNQYGETYTGMPNGRATTMPLCHRPGCPRRPGCSSWPVATTSMLRASGASPGGPQLGSRLLRACSQRRLGRAARAPDAGVARKTARNVGGLPYGCAVDIENTVDDL